MRTVKKLYKMVQISENDRLGACVTVNRNRLKTYGNSVYLKSGTPYEIEMWNMGKSRVIAYVNLDGKLISGSGIIVNPGQRIYLERWIDSPKKFTFKTYEIDGSRESLEATVDNGEVKISFHDEITKNLYPSGMPANFFYYTSGGSSSIVNDKGFNFSTGGTTYNNPFTITNASIGGSLFTNTTTDSSVHGEGNFFAGDVTGCSEQGETSGQRLEESSGDFNTWSSKIVTWKIQPEEKKPVEISKIRSYCTECGTRVRSSSWKFCPSCGEQF